MQSYDIEQGYSRLADQYIDLFASGKHEHVDDLHLITRHLTGLTGLVLDLGCGPGHLTGFLNSSGVEARGIDLVPEFIEHARSAHPSVNFQVGSMTDLPLPAASVAGALAWYSMIHLDPEELGPALSGIRRVLKPGGVLVLGFFAGDSVEPFDHKVVTALRWPIDELSARLCAAGFEELERLERGQEGERRRHGALVARAV